MISFTNFLWVNKRKVKIDTEKRLIGLNLLDSVSDEFEIAFAEISI